MSFSWAKAFAGAGAESDTRAQLAALCHEFLTGDLLLLHGGLVGSADVSRMREACQALIGRVGVSEMVARHLFSALVEFSDNIAYYSKLQVEQAGYRHLGGLGLVAAVREDGHIAAYSANPCERERGERVLETVAAVNALTPEEVRRLYRDKSRQRTARDSKGAGLGFLHIARSTPRPIEAALVPGEEHFILILSAAFSIQASSEGARS